MPVEHNWLNFLQLSVLLLCLPIQFWLTRSNSESERQFALDSVINTISDFKKTFLNWDFWAKLCSDVFNLSGGELEADATPPEVLKKNQSGFFGSSDEPRSPRPPHIRFRVGQIVRHKRHGYRGVIMGWDETAKAPDTWLDQMHPKDKPHWRQLPNYAVLVDTRDRYAPQLAYAVEENIEVITNTKIFHPSIDVYFESYDGKTYKPRPWLKKVYPHD